MSDIEIDDETLEAMLEEVRSLSPEELMRRLDRHRENSIGMQLQYFVSRILEKDDAA